MILKQQQGTLCLRLACFAFALLCGGMLAAQPLKAAEKDWSKGKINTLDSAAEIQFRLEPASVEPGGKAKLSIEIVPQDSWYLYEWSANGEPKIAGGAGKPILVHLEGTKELTISGPTPSIDPEPKLMDDGSIANVYKKPISFVYQISVPATQAEGELELNGGVAVQACDKSCLLPEGFNFRVKLPVTKTAGTKVPEAEWIKGNYNKIKAQVKAASAGNTGTNKPTKSDSPTGISAKENTPSTDQKAPPVKDMQLDVVGGEVNSLSVALLFALIGGLILNLMPCVLPVIGLKILSFVEQAGKNRKQIFLLNLFYSLGIISVFMVLAALAAAFGLGWGEQSQEPAFNISMMAIIFAMALSFLGVWEIPIPGFATTPGIAHSTQRVGYEGAFVKGVITTLLATPCSGPLLGTVFALTAKLPPLEILLIYFTVGLGMASPYLIIGAYPKAVKFLPKAGAWMDTFKQLMGFVLLGTVVWLFTLILSSYYIPTLILLFSLWFALWMVGRVPIYETKLKRLKPWLIGGPIAGLLSVWGFWFYLFYENPNELKWQNYTPAVLSQATSSGKTVLLDLTADWCATCKANLFFSINQFEVKELVTQYDVIAIKADLSEPSAETKHLLNVQLQSKSIPVLAIYPANAPDNPIILRDVVTKDAVIEALKKAGPSKPSAAKVITTGLSKEAMR